MKKKQYGLLKIGVLSALMMLIIMMPSMIQNHGIYIIRGDYVDQYIPRLIRSREILLSGGATWDWFNFLGSAFNKINILFSLNAVCLLFPSDVIPYAVTYLHLVRAALIAMSAYAYFRYMVKEEKNAFLGALLYTFSSYTFIHFEFMQFLEVLWTFPLLLLSAEMFFREEKYYYQLILTVFLSCSTSFYLFVFSTLWFVIYFLCRFCLAEEWRPKRTGKWFFLAVAEYLLGFFCAFLIFAPFLYNLFHSSGSTAKIGATNRFLIEYVLDLDFVSRVFSFLIPGVSNRFSSFGGSNWNSRAAYLPVFGIAFVLAGWRKKESPKWLKLLSLSGVACVLVPFLCLVFNMFSAGYARHGFGAMLFFTLATVYFLEDYDEQLAKKSVWKTLEILAVLLTIYYLADSIIGDHPDLFYLIHGRVQEKEIEQMHRLYALAIAAVFYAILLGFVYAKSVRQRIIPVTVAVILLYGCSYTVMNLRSDFLLDYCPESTIDLRTQAERYLMDLPKMEEGTDYRIDSPQQLNNYTYTAKKPSISIFESVRSSYADELCEYLQYFNGGVRIFPQKNDNETRTLLGVKYYYDTYPEDAFPVPENFTYLRTDNQVDVYQNDNFIGMGFSYDRYITRTEFDRLVNKGEHGAQLMLNALVVDEEDVGKVQKWLKPYQPGYRCENRISFDEFSMTSDGFTAGIRLEKPTMMYVPVSYEDQGWTATCNGEPLEFLKGNVGLIAFPLGAGENKVVFQYRSPVDQLGRYVTCLGWIALLVYVMIRERRQEKEKGESASS